MIMPTPTIAHRLDALASWRSRVDLGLAHMGRTLSDDDLLGSDDQAALAALRERVVSDKLVLAFVAEFSRGKSELINAIFFGDSGRRVLPATPGRTTMCPVELRHDEGVPPRLMLLPMATRLQGRPLSELRDQPAAWQHVALDPADPQALAHALTAVTRTQRVSVAHAAALGLWNPSQPEDNPPQDSDGQVEVPAWRHALVNYPHPLLMRGLVVIDTPGLNALGAEPELTLGLLPSAHAAVFVLGADTGVTRSDLTLWRDHLGAVSLDRFVVLNKIDTLADPLLSATTVQAQIERQREHSAHILGVPLQRVFAVSARDALAARVAGDAQGLAASRLAPLEQALAEQLLPRRQQQLWQATTAVVQQLHHSAGRRLAERRRQHVEQLLELRGLRGKSGTKLRVMLERIDQEVADFECCRTRLAALRSVQSRMLTAATSVLDKPALQRAMQALQRALVARSFDLLGVGARPAFEAFFNQIDKALIQADWQADEMRLMLEASFGPLNTEFAFAFALQPRPEFKRFRDELALIAKNYSTYVSMGQAWRLLQPGFVDQFLLLLASKLRGVFEAAAGELAQWSQGASDQVLAQLHERRLGFARRRDALQRVQTATGELEHRIAEVQQQDDLQAQVLIRLNAVRDKALAAAGVTFSAGSAPGSAPAPVPIATPAPTPAPPLTTQKAAALAIAELVRAELSTVPVAKQLAAA